MNLSEKRSISELHAIALQEAKKIDTSKIEYCISIDEFGNIQYFKGNDENVTADKSFIMIHNHPNKYKEPMTFSYEDLHALLYNPDIFEGIVCSYGYCFVFRCGTLPRMYNGGLLSAKEILAQYTSFLQKTEREQYKKYVESGASGSESLKVLFKKYEIAVLREMHSAFCRYCQSISIYYGKYKL